MSMTTFPNLKLFSEIYIIKGALFLNKHIPQIYIVRTKYYPSKNRRFKDGITDVISHPKVLNFPKKYQNSSNSSNMRNNHYFFSVIRPGLKEILRQVKISLVYNIPILACSSPYFIHIC